MQGDWEFEAILGYIVKSFLKKKNYENGYTTEKQSTDLMQFPSKYQCHSSQK
jgi:hypothetical protein